MRWLTPGSVEEALRMKAENPESMVVAGGTFLGILTRQGLLEPERWLSLQRVRELTHVSTAGDLSIGAMVRHRQIEAHPEVRASFPAVARVFGIVASPRVRNVATIGGVLADADYASDPPSMLVACEAWVEAASTEGTRRIAVEDLIVGHYETSLAEAELITRVVIPRGATDAAYRKLCTRSVEDRPAVSVSAVRKGGSVRVVVGAVNERPQHFPHVCARFDVNRPETAREVGDGYADLIDPISDARGSAEYRRRAIAVEVRRALEEIAV